MITELVSARREPLDDASVRRSVLGSIRAAVLVDQRGPPLKLGHIFRGETPRPALGYRLSSQRPSPKVCRLAISQPADLGPRDWRFGRMQR